MGYIEEQIRELREIAEMYDGMDGGEILKESADTIESLYNKLNERSNNGWIQCSEQLPTKEECIKNDCRFIVSDGNRVHQGTFDYEINHFVWHSCSGIQMDRVTIAWMPLPEIYKEEG